MKIALFQQTHMVHRTLRERLRCRRAIFCKDFLLERTTVDADADRNPVRLAGVGHSLDPLVRADIAGIDADFIHPRLHTGKGDAVIEMDIRHNRHGHRLFQSRDQWHRVQIRHRSADDLTTGLI